MLTLLLTTVALGAADWQSLDAARYRPLDVPSNGHPGFQKLDPAALGIAFTNVVSRDRALRNRNLLNGSGVAAGDVDGDGGCDLYFCALDTSNALYRNLGQWRFQDITRESGVACDNQDSTGAAFVDVDGDGDLDLLVTSLNHGTRLFENDGHGRFHDITASSGLLPDTAGMSLALADIDGDGDLDLYVAHYRPDTIADQPSTTYRLQIVDNWPVIIQVNGQPATAPQWTNRFEVSPLGRVIERGLADTLYLNDGHGHFRPVPFTQGAFLDAQGRPLQNPPFDWGLAVQFHDLNGDGAPDLYVCNDFVSPDRVWLNDGTGHFRALPKDAIRTTSAFSMGVDFADIDRDGQVDICVVDMLSPNHQMRHVQLGEKSTSRPPPGLVYDRLQVSRNTLHRNRGDGTFAEIAWFAGVEATDWSWQPDFLDVDLDGYEDLLVCNGAFRDFQNVDFAESMERAEARRKLTFQEVLDWIGRIPPLETPNVAFRNKGDLTFENTGAAWGFATAGISQGMALADLDNDGDMDVVVNNLLAPPGLFRNESPAPRIAVRLRGQGANSAGIGARIQVRGGPVLQSQEMIAGGRYLSGDQAQRVFAAGSLTSSPQIEVTWRSGRISKVAARPNTLVEIDEASSLPAPASAAPPVQPWFVDFTGLPPTLQVEQPFDEATRQPLLLRHLDRLGPGVTWHDLDGDGWDDLLVGNGRGSLPIVLLNQQGTGFQRATNSPFNHPLPRDQTALLAVKDAILAGSSNFEDGSTNAGLVRVYDSRRRASGESLVGYPFACGPLALADIDADGDLDLFVGGRAIAGRYPEPADSILFRNDSGRFTPLQRWERLGLVSGAVFSDLDGDGTPELVLAPDWSSLRVFKWQHDRYREMTRDWGLESDTGWWAGVATGDIDGDGRLDIVASNWGLNSEWRASAERPRRLYFGDLDDNGSVDLIEARMDPVLGKEVPELTFNWAAAAMPFLHARVPDYATYARDSVQEIYGDAFQRTHLLQVTTLASTLFLNRGTHFEKVPLPPEAQFAPAFGVCIGDLDGNGTEDVFLAQNFFDVAPAATRCDSGLGLVLAGDGRGGLSALPPARSGIRIPGEQRGAALCDFDGDGRVDLAVGQNGDSVRLFRNLSARPGLRIRLQGPAGNPDGVGVQIRLFAGQTAGPAREIQAGSGFWSQNSPVQVMNLADGRPPARVQVRWPGGRTNLVELPAGAREITIGMEGSLHTSQ